MRNLESNVIKEVAYINKILNQKKKGLNRIAEDEYNSSDKVIIKRLAELGYKRVKNQFIQEVVQEVVQHREVATVDVLEPIKSITVYEDRKEITDLIDNHKILMEIVEQYKSNNVVPVGDIVVQLPYEEDKSYKISMRVNKPVMDQFKEFCSNYNNFSQKDLLSMALVEYMENHK